MKEFEIIEHSYKGESRLKKRNKTTEIILHCAATREGNEYSVNDIDRWHRQRGFTMIGYQFVIYLNGSVHRGRPEYSTGAHCTNHNSCSIGVCYIGGCDNKMKPKDTRTPEQKESMFRLVQYLMEKYKLSLNAIHCHNEFAAKACPSFKIDEFKKEYKEWLDTRKVN